MSRGSLNGRPEKVTPNGAGSGTKPAGNGGALRRHRGKPAWHDDARVAGFGRSASALIAREQNRVEVIVRSLDAVWPVEDGVEAGARELEILRSIRLIAERVGAARIGVELIHREENVLVVLTPGWAVL